MMLVKIFRSRSLALLVVILSSVTFACTGSTEKAGTVLEPMYRFIDPELNPATNNTIPDTVASNTANHSRPRNELVSTGLPVASIDNDTRYVLKSPAAEVIVHSQQLLVPPSGRLVYEARLRGALEGSKRLVTESQYKVGNSWKPLKRLLATVEHKATLSTVSLAWILPKEVRGKKIRINVKGWTADLKGSRDLTTGEITLPPNAVLEVATGVLSPAWDQGSVEFHVSTCLENECAVLLDETRYADSAGGAWRDHSLDLSEYSGQSRSFTFKWRVSAEGSFSLPVWANPTIYAPSPRKSENVNVILISIDTLRADHLTTHGYRHDTAPFIDRTFGSMGTVFSGCVAAATTTAPSHMSIFTGLQPCVHGITTGMETLPESFATLAEIMRNSNVETGAITENAWLSVKHGFARGFNTYVENKSAKLMVPVGQVDRTFSRARDWLEVNHTKPFFLFLHTYQVHDPYFPPTRYAEMFPEHQSGMINEQSPQHLRWLANYDREIRYTDDELSLLFDKIRELGLESNTVVILTSDHGEEFLEHGYLKHGAHLYEEVLRVPLMFWGAGIPEGVGFHGAAAHIDIMPTILDLAGVDQILEIQGKSLAQGIRNGKLPKGPSRPAYSEAHSKMAIKRGQSLQRVERPSYSVRSGDQKLHRYRTTSGFRYEFYDLTSDPNERINLYKEKPQTLSELKGLLDGYEETCRASQIALRLKNKNEDPNSGEKARLDPEQEEKLRALGYLE